VTAPALAAAFAASTLAALHRPAGRPGRARALLFALTAAAAYAALLVC